MDQVEQIRQISKFHKLKFSFIYYLLTCTVLSVLLFIFFSRKSGKASAKCICNRFGLHSSLLLTPPPLSSMKVLCIYYDTPIYILSTVSSTIPYRFPEHTSPGSVCINPLFRSHFIYNKPS